MKRTLIAAAVASCSALCAAAPANAALDELVLVSAPLSLDDPSSNRDSTDPSISADGTLVAFSSTGESLSQADAPGVLNVYVKNVRTGVITLVSRQSGTGDISKGANGTSDAARISADGRFVAFQSFANNLAGGADGPSRDVFVRDLVAKTTVLVSRATSAAGAGGDAESDTPSISGDGRLVTFRSSSTNFSTEDDGTKGEIYVRDLVENTTTLVSRPTGVAPLPPGDEYSGGEISRDGRFVAFVSSSDSLSTEDNDTFENVYLRELATNTTTLISRQAGLGPASLGADGRSRQASVSGSGRFVAFASEAANLSSDDNVPEVGDVFVRDTVAQTTTLVSRQGGLPPASLGANGYSGYPSISDDGRYVSFESKATNLDLAVAAADNVYHRDLQTGALRLVSRPPGASGPGANGPSYAASISPDGRYVAFDSTANNLSSLDRDPTADVFVRDVLGDPPPPQISTSGAPTGAAPVPPAPQVKRIPLSSLLTAPSTKRCVAKRRITLRLKSRGTITTLVIKVSGSKKAKTVLGTKLLKPMTLTGLPRGSYTVSVAATLADGTTQKASKRYRACAAKKKAKPKKTQTKK